MNKQQFDQQIEYVRRELTRISQEVQYQEGTQLQTLRVRQSRLAAELERLEAQRRHDTFSMLTFVASSQLSNANELTPVNSAY